MIGDGVLTVRQLVEPASSDPRRGDGHATSLTKIRFDDIAIARLDLQGLQPEFGPPPGRRSILRNNANLSTGGTATDVTDACTRWPLAPSRRRRPLNLDICGGRDVRKRAPPLEIKTVAWWK